MGGKTNNVDLNLEGPEVVGKIPPDEMTSKDYYFDSYAHFGIHEVMFIFIFFLLFQV